MIAEALGPVFLLILLGTFLKWFNFPGGTFWPGVERLTYFLLFPSLLIYKLTYADFNAAPLGKITASIITVLVIVSVGIFSLRRYLAKDGPAFTSVFQGSIRFNTYIGLACAKELYGEAGLVLAAVIVAVLIPCINFLCVLCFCLEGKDRQFRWKALALSIIQNPLIIACVLGFSLNQSGIGLPGWSASILSILSAAALPLGLLAVGVALDLKAITGATREIISSSVVKFILMPAFMMIACHLYSLETDSQRILILFTCLPTASSAYILAGQLGGNAPLMANIITLQSLLSFAVMPAWVGLADKIIS